jgi:hypothetical protein
MPQRFDPYHKWLGIPAEEQPASHYRLLGIPLYEPDQEVIASAAVQRMNWLRTFQSGANGADAKRLLAELAQAWACLLNPQRKQDYDNQLRSQFAALRSALEEATADEAIAGIPDLPAEAVPPFLMPVDRPAPDFPSFASPSTFGSPATFTPTPAAGPPPLAEPPVSSGEFVRPAARKPSAPGKSKKRASIWPMVISPFLGLAAGYLILCLIKPQADFLHLFSKNEPPQQRAPEDKPQEVAKQPPNPQPETPAKKTPPNPPPTRTPPTKRPPRDEPTPKAPARLKVPTEEEQRVARSRFNATYRRDFTAATDRTKKIDLIAKILTDLEQSTEVPTWYVAMRAAQALAQKTGELDSAFEIAYDIGQQFETDPFQDQSAILSTVEISTELLAQRSYLSGYLERRWDGAISANRYDFAAALASFLSRLHQTAADSTTNGAPGDVSQKQEAARDLQLANIFAAAAEAFKMLAKDPADGKASAAAGRFLCFEINKWELGLPLLAKGDDANLRDIAIADLVPAKSTEQQTALADRWFDLAAADESHAKAIRTRALELYQSALPQLAAAERARVEQRIASLELTEKVAEDRDAPDTTPAIASIRTAQALDQAANRRRRATEAHALYKQFLADPQIPDSEKEIAQKRLSFWADYAAKNLIRMGDKWAPPDEYVRVKKDVNEQIQRALEMLSTEHAKAIALLQKASRADPDAVQPHFVLGLARALVERDYRAAKPHFRRCDACEPENFAVLNNLALATALAGDDTGAIVLFRRALKAAPNSPAVFHNLTIASEHSLRKTWTVTLAATTAYKKLVDDLRAQGVVDSTGARGWLYMFPAAGEFDLPYVQVLRGAHRHLTIDGNWIEDQACVTCAGSSNVRCSECEGRGWINSRGQVGIGGGSSKKVVGRQTCPQCKGNKIRDCPRCNEGRDPGI